VQIAAVQRVAHGAGWQYVREYIRFVSEELSGRTVGGVQLRSLRLAELSWRVWKADAFRGEFWFFNIPGTHRKSNRALFYDILDLGITWHNEDAKYVTAEDFEKLQLDILTPRYWNWRALGRENEGKFDTFWQALWGILF